VPGNLGYAAQLVRFVSKCSKC